MLRLPGLVVVLLYASACASPAASPEATPDPSAVQSPPTFEQMRKIDVHSHVFEDLPVLHDMLRRTNVRLIDICNPDTDGHPS